MKNRIALEELPKAPTENLKQNLRNLDDEKPTYDKNIAHHKKLIETNQKRLALTEKLHAISDEKSIPLTPQYEFQRDPEWLSLQKELLKINSAAERERMAGEIENLQRLVEKNEEEHERNVEYRQAIVEELKKRGELDE